MPAFSLSEVQRQHRQAAELMLRDAAFAPIFERFEEELRLIAGAGDVDDPVTRARAALQSLKTYPATESHHHG